MPMHIPVLLNETTEILIPALRKKNKSELPILADLNLGCGNHSLNIYKVTGGQVFILGIDCDQNMLNLAKDNFLREGVPDHKFKLFRANFEDVDEVVDKIGLSKVNAVLYDLGLNSAQVDNPDRGFSFRFDGPLDMRFDDRLKTTAADIVNSCSADELKRLFREYGDEKNAKIVADAIVKKRKIAPIITTGRLAEVVVDALPQKLKFSGHLHPGTKVFQSLRIAVNNELEVLRRSLRKSAALLAKDGVIAAISYHSGEDRIIKHFFRDLAAKCKCPIEQPFCSCGGIQEFKILTPQPIMSSEKEIEANPRARSGKLRGIRKIYEADKIK